MGLFVALLWTIFLAHTGTVSNIQRHCDILKHLKTPDYYSAQNNCAYDNMKLYLKTFKLQQ